jgi:hypothetical protein
MGPVELGILASYAIYFAAGIGLALQEYFRVGSRPTPA